MNFKKHLLLLLLMFASTFLGAQQLNDIKGQVKSEEGRVNLEFCSVVVLNTKNEIVKGGITTENGYFNIPVENGVYKIAVSFVGFISDTLDLGNVMQSKFIGEVLLKQSAESLKGIEVKGSANISVIDKDIQVVTAEMKKASMDTKEVLEKINGVAYDRYNDAIKVDNNSNVIILVDGVEKNQDYIKNMDPKRLKRIEIVRDPGGRYGLEDYAAVINVVLVKNYKGTEAFFFNQAISDFNPNKGASYIPVNNLYVSLNHTYNKFNIYGSLSNNYSDFALKSYTESIYENGRRVEENYGGEDDNFFVINKQMNYTLGADYYINPKHSISVETSIKNLPKSTENINGDYQSFVMQDADTTSLYDLSMNNASNTVNSYSTVFYRGKFTNKSSMGADLSYSHSKYEYDNFMNQEFSYSQFDVGSSITNLTKVNVYFDYDLSKRSSFQIGYSNLWKNSERDYSIESKPYMIDNGFTVNYNFNSIEKRNMLYGYFSQKIGKKMSVKIGLAAEHSSLSNNDIDNNYLIYQPFFTYFYKPNAMLNFSLKYRSTSMYPGSSQTDSSLIRVDPYTLSKGNPELKPTVVHRISLRINALQGLISIEPYYHFSNNYIGQMGSLLNDSLTQFTYENVGFYQNIGTKVNFTIPIGKRIVIQNGFNFYSSKITFSDNNVNQVNDWSADIKAILLEKGRMPMFILMYQRANVKNINSLGYSTGNNDYWLFLIQKEFFKKKMSVMLGYMLPVDFGANYIQATNMNINNYEKNTYNDISVLKNLALIKLTYRFNQGKIVKKTEKDFDKELEDYGGKKLM